MERLRACRLYCYHMLPETFVCFDAGAGYFVSQTPVVPTYVEIVDDLIAALLQRGVELRFAPSLWSLHDAVVASSLEFSLIRMQNAMPRE